MISVHDISMKGKFVCEYCSKPFSKETAFLQHKCKQMERYEIIRTPVGQLAWNCYKFWLKLQRRAVDDVSLFIQTGNFTNFCKFAEWTKKTNLDWQSYITLMVKKNYTPNMWLRDDVIGIFLKSQKRDSYRDTLLSQIDMLYDLSEEFGVDISELPDILEIEEIHQLVKRGIISVVFILFCPKFSQKIKEQATQTHLQTFDEMVKKDEWDKLLQQKNVVEDIKQCLRSVNLL